LRKKICRAARSISGRGLNFLLVAAFLLYETLIEISAARTSPAV
jgi:hypothetical protein